MKNLLILITICVFFTTNAQIGVGPIEYVKLNSGTFTQDELDRIKSSGTIFVCNDSDSVDLLQSEFEKVWTITNIKVVPYSKMNWTLTSSASVFSIGGLFVTHTNTKTQFSYENMHVYLHLWMPKLDRKKSERGRSDSYARIELYPIIEDFFEVSKLNEEKAYRYLYEKGTFRNWNAGFLKIYLKVVNDLLKAETERWLYVDEEKNPQLRRLRSQTLFVPKYALINFNKFNGDESRFSDPEEVFSSYPYKYKVETADKISEMILKSEEAFYFMIFVKSSTDKYIYIFNSKTGEIIYSKYVGMSYKMKDSDIKDIAKSIKKVSK